MILIEYDSTGQVLNIAVAEPDMDLTHFPNHALIDETKYPTFLANWAWSTYDAATQTLTVSSPPPPTLDDAKTMQSALIETAYAKAMEAGVTSSADGTSRVYLVNSTMISDVGLARTISQATYPTSGIEAELLDGTYIALTYAQMQTLSNDLQNFYLPNRSKRIKLLGQIKAATTVADVQAITW